MSEPILEQQLKALNSITFEGQTYPFSGTNIALAIHDITNVPFEELAHIKKVIYDL